MAMRFNGISQYVGLSNNPVFAGSEITMMSWVSPAAMPSGMSVICSTNSISAGFRAPFALYYMNGRLTGQITYSYRAGFIITYLAYDVVTVTSNRTTTVNTWQHVAFTFTGGVVRLYENGILTGEVITTRMPVSGNTAYVGADQTAANAFQGFYNGVMEDFRIYNRAMTANEILTVSTLRGKDNILNGGVTQMGMNEMTNNTLHPRDLPVFNLFNNSVIGLAVGGPSYHDSFANILKRW